MPSRSSGYPAHGPHLKTACPSDLREPTSQLDLACRCNGPSGDVMGRGTLIIVPDRGATMPEVLTVNRESYHAVAEVLIYLAEHLEAA